MNFTVHGFHQQLLQHATCYAHYLRRSFLQHPSAYSHSVLPINSVGSCSGPVSSFVKENIAVSSNKHGRSSLDSIIPCSIHVIIIAGKIELDDSTCLRCVSGWAYAFLHHALHKM